MIKLAIVHDYLTQMGGAERIVLSIHEAFPDAPMFTSIYFPDRTFKEFKDVDIRTTYLQRLYEIFPNHRMLLTFYPRAFRKIDLRGFDVVLSSTSSFAKGITKPKGAIHISYCYNTTRFIWMKDLYLAQERFTILKKLYMGLFLKRLRQWDLNAAKNVDHFLAISLTVKERIKRFYQKESSLLYPPIECDRFKLSDKNEGFYVVVSRLLAHKRIDIAIKAFNILGPKLKVIGSGPQYSVLKKMASKNIEFVGSLEGDELVDTFSRCEALIYPQEEDFGLAPLEANALGKPVIAFAKGGVLESMKPYDSTTKDGTAIFFYRQTPQDLIEAVKKLPSLRFDSERLRKNAMLFDKSIFISNIRKKVETFYKEKR